jgi:hypothetical protein
MGEIERCGEGCGARCFLRGGMFGGVELGESVSLGGGVGRTLVRCDCFCFRRCLRLVGVACSIASSSLKMSSSERVRQGSAAIGCGPRTCARGDALAILKMRDSVQWGLGKVTEAYYGGSGKI